MRLPGHILLVGVFAIISCEDPSENQGDGSIVNPEGAPVLTCDNFKEDITLEDDPSRSVDYIIDCLVEVDDIEIGIFDGAVVEFTEGSGFIFHEGSRINFYALPGAVPPVVLRGNKAEPGYWKGIHVDSDQGSNFIFGVEVHHAGSTSDDRFYGAVTIGGGVRLGNTWIDQSENYGVYFEDDIGLYNTFGHVEITNSGNYPVRIGLADVSELGGQAINSYSGNNPDRIQVAVEPLTKTTTFRDQGIPFEINETIIANEILTVEDNVELLFGTGTRLIIEKQLSAWDNSGDPIVFRSQDGVAGGWKGIYFKTATGSNTGYNTLINILVEDGGDDSDLAANIAIESGKVNLQDSQIRNSKSCGLKYIDAQTTLINLDNIFINNQQGNVCLIN